MDDVVNRRGEVEGEDEKENGGDFGLWKCGEGEEMMGWG